MNRNKLGMFGRILLPILFLIAAFVVIVLAGSRFTAAGWIEAIRWVADTAALQWLGQNGTYLAAVGLAIALISIPITYFRNTYLAYVDAMDSKAEALRFAVGKLLVMAAIVYAYAHLIAYVSALFGGQVPQLLEGSEIILSLGEALLFFVLTYEVGKLFDRWVLPQSTITSETTGVV